MMELGGEIKADVDKGKYTIFVNTYLQCWMQSQAEYNTGGRQNKENDDNKEEAIVIRRDILWDL